MNVPMGLTPDEEAKYLRDFGGEGPDEGCPKCESLNVTWKGGDNVVNLGGEHIMTHVDWYKCGDCGHRWSESFDHDGPE